MWWKLYFYLNIVASILFFFGMPTEGVSERIVYGIHLLLFYLGVFGVYSYVYRKKFLPGIAWFGILFLIVLNDLLYLLSIVFPQIALLSVLNYAEDTSVSLALVSITYSLPIYFAVYQLAMGNVLPEHSETGKEQVIVTRWSIIQIAFWGYSTVMVFLGLIFSLLPSEEASQITQDDVLGVLFFLPLLFFWMMLLFQRKLYHWDWWRRTLILTSALYSGILVFGVVNPAVAPVEQSEISLFDIVPLVIILVTLIVLGKEQLEKQEISDHLKKIKYSKATDTHHS